MRKSDQQQTGSWSRSRRPLLLSALALVLVLVVSLLVEAWVGRIERVRLADEFLRAAEQQAEAVEGGLLELDGPLIQSRELLGARQVLSLDSFRQVAALRLARHPELLALGWIPRIAPGSEADLVRKARVEGRRTYEVEPAPKGVAEDRPRYPLFYLEGRSGQSQLPQDLLGKDLAALPRIESQLLESRDFGMARILALGGTSLAAPSRLWMVLPVYGNGTQPGPRSLRRREHLGFLLAVWDSDAWLASALSPFSVGWTRVRLGQGDREGYRIASHGRTAWEAGVAARKGEMDLVSHRRMHVHGADLGLVITPGPAFLQQRRSIAPGVALLTTAFFLLIFVLSVRILFARKHNATDLIVRRTRVLKESQQQLECQIEAAEHAQHRARLSAQTLREFLSRISQEIRAPMTALLGYADSITDPDLDDQDRKEHVEVMRRNGRHLLAIYGDLQDLARIDAGKIRVELGSCDPLRILKEVGYLMSVRAAALGLDLKLATRKGLPAQIHSDAARLRQILMSLSRLGVDLTRGGEVKLRLSGEVDQPLRMEVECSDALLSSEQVQGLLDADMESEEGALEQAGGSALVLDLMRRIVEALGGRIDVSDLADRGWILGVEIPSTRPPEESSLLEESSFEDLERSLDPGEEHLKGQRILIADDSADDRLLLRHVLERAGAQIEEAHDGSEVLEQILTRNALKQPDLLILDLQMPEVDGLQAARRLRQEGFDGPILAMSAHATEKTETDCLRAGCDRFLEKPIDKQQLLLALTALLPRATITA